MDIEYIKKSTEKCLELLSNVYSSMNTFVLTGYSQQKTNVNCMEILQEVYKQIKYIKEEVESKDIDKSK